MSQESIAEAIAPRQWYNPFPKVRYTERPDAATALRHGGRRAPAHRQHARGHDFSRLDPALCRGDQRLLLPAARWVVSADRAARRAVSDDFRHAALVPARQVTRYAPRKPPLPAHRGGVSVPLILQLLLVELIIDVLKLASLNTPDVVLGNSFSMLGALILGDFAVQSRWLVPEVLVYMAFVAIANFTQHSFEMSYACKLCRMALLVMIWLFDWWGFALGIVGISRAHRDDKTPRRARVSLPAHPLRRQEAPRSPAPAADQPGEHIKTRRKRGFAALRALPRHGRGCDTPLRAKCFLRLPSRELCEAFAPDKNTSGGQCPPDVFCALGYYFFFSSRRTSSASCSSSIVSPVTSRSRSSAGVRCSDFSSQQTM